ncbi:NYN domain-containing protein [Candidatus Pacearchaeota archaeon]|nr:MAG: NYN domain-containing protein [Candidatus Pacearchaeota archaeon]
MENCKDKEKIMIFIDGSNHYKLVKELFDGSKRSFDFNFEKFVKGLAKNRKIVRVYYYTAPLDRKKDKETYAKQQRFFEKLRKIPNFKLELVLCRMQKVKIDGKICYQVKEDDIHLAVDIVKLAYNNAYYIAVLVSSDGDFVPAVNAVQEIGKFIENMGFPNKFSWHLRQQCDNFVKLRKNFLEECFD